MSAKSFRQRFGEVWKSSRAGAVVCVVLLSVLAVACGQKEKGTAVEPNAPASSGEQTSATSAGSGYQIETVASGGMIAGVVRLKGKVPPARIIPVQQDAQVCGQRRTVYPVRVVGGCIVDAVVWIDDIQRGKAYDFPKPVLDQKDCEYVPHVLVMQPGDLTVISSDPMPHNVHTYPTANPTANENMNPLVRTVTLHLGRPDIVSVKCDLHGWMQAYVVVAKNPYYAVTGPGGRFELRDVPAGHYRLKVWQETLGTGEQDVEVRPGETTRVEFVLTSSEQQAAEVH